jgi:glutathione S-transferase
MKLFYAPGTCSLAPHILLRETAAEFQLERVDLKRRQTASGERLDVTNPKGKVPVLETDDGSLLTEGAVIAQYVAERAAARRLLPAPGDPARYRVLEWQTFVTTELHKSYSPLFHPALDAASKQVFAADLRRKYEWVDARLAGADYLTGPEFTVADAYLYAVSRWAPAVGVEIGDLPDLQACLARIAARPAVQAALEAEGLRA